ncbi:uncharacterized protein LOC127100750 isoform X2 [Lathyrus oleraceus]|uniref:B-block binding subunit of TFIIIC n=1 Tax=Pisum sativum TaxID=3888 RepID=A0A9D4YIR0_PEA|nr:uncharacterized protein LOC127100750 isoform X2 [Pisum sativum]KAI5440336.1 hypothetical protein KIW84_010007 [Pisum sativum]
MDSVLNAALEEICSQVEHGLTLQSLWSKLHSSHSSPLTTSFQKSVFTNLLRIPTLRFDPPNPKFDANHGNIKIFPQQTLANNFVGLYDPQLLQQAQLRVLHLLANAKHDGITQTQLSKLLKIDPNNFHYVLRSLECKGLIVKRSALEKKKQIGGISTSSSYVPTNISTNLVYLRRYAKSIAEHQRFELQITQFNNPDQKSELQTNVVLADYEPQIKAISDKLANANGKVLPVTVIKKDLGYSGSRPKQRAWRQIAHRLKTHHIVEQFDAKVNGKIEPCMRLLDPITTGSGKEDKKSDSGSISQVNDQFVELPIEHQVFDMVDTAGSDGISIKEICDRLQIDLKKNHLRLVNLCYRFGMRAQEELCDKAKTIRVWTSRNFNPELEVSLIHKLDENKVLDQHVPDSSSKIITESESSTFKGELVGPDQLEDIGAGSKLLCASTNNVETPTNLQDSALDQRGTISHSKPVSLPRGANSVLSEASYDVSTQFTPGAYPRYSSLSITSDSTKRAIRILEKLKDERFVLRPELNRWLNTFEKNKSKKVDRKTIDRILAILQEQGQCKCITVHSPVIAEYSRTTDCVVIMHPSLSLSPELFDEMRDKVRSFNTFIRSKSIRPRKNDESIPVMEDIQKVQSDRVPGRQAEVAEAMRANGFILSKMIRAKLLHCFLWDYLHKSESHSDTLSSNGLDDNPHSSSKLFSLDAAIKAIPLELFLQVAGSTKKYEEMIDKCKMGLCLADLPPNEYKCLIDTLATGRLSLVIDTLRRLKLIRMITSQSTDGVKTPHSLTHMMELRPYIEEPLSNDEASLSFMSHDLRPRIRHDFILFNRYAVDEYWRTLEYCYAAANKKAALYAFPGSVVHEVFRFRSWASNRVMTAEQRAELLKHVSKHDLTEKISYKDCEKIAKDLNLTLEQVLSMYYSKRRQCLNQLNAEESENNSLQRKDVMGKHIDEQHNMDIHSKELVTHVQEFEEGNHEIEGSQDCSPSINQCILTSMTAMRPPRQSRFIWSDKTDRQLVIQYVRHRAVLGANYHRIDWTSLTDLPSAPSACRRRMSLLNGNLRFRKAVNKLCSMLSERYAKQLEKSQNLSSNKDDCRLFVQSQSSKGVHNSFSPDVEIQKGSLNGEAWDDFENKSIKAALEEILRCKMMAKLDASSQNVQSQYEDWNRYESQENKKTTLAVHSEIIQSHHGKPQTFSSQRSRLDMKISKFLNNRPSIYGQVYESLAVSNAVELFKLVFLSTATSPQAPNLLADILRRYSEHDLLAAFNYLREKKIMVGGNNSRFELSQRFLHSVSQSPFPFETGKQAVKFSAWLKERDKDLNVMGTDLAEDLQCGETFHLFALISSGELSISPSLPTNGVGEADDLRSGKRKSDASGSSFSDKAKKSKSSFGTEGEIISRREKGFPGIIVSVHRTAVSRADILDLFKENDNNNNDQHFEGNFQVNTAQSSNYSFTDHMLETVDSCDQVPENKSHIESPWEAMAEYVRRLMTVPSDQEQECAVCAEVFMVVYAAIMKAGDQGLSMGEISQAINLPGADVDGLVVDALQAFGKAIKVNAYDSVRIVDAPYRHKYFLTAEPCFHPVQPSSNKTDKESDNTCKLYKSEESGSAAVDVLRERNTGLDNVHKVTILNLPHMDVDHEKQACDKNEGSMQIRFGPSRRDHEKEIVKFSSGELCMPILPWVNGDGTINSVVFKGLKRRVLGIVMQNPGILEEDILRQMHVLNPQSCRTLLELMALDKHLILRKMYQRKFGGGPSMLQNLIGSKSSQEKWICADHFFANPTSTSLL